MEAITTNTNNARVATNFLINTIFPRFGCPRALIRDNGTHFIEKNFESLLKKYGVLHKYALPYNPRSSGQVEISNRELKLILEKTMQKSRKIWSNKLDDAFWAYMTAFKTPIGTKTFLLIYGKHSHLVVELEHKAHWVIRTLNFDLKSACEKRLLDLNEIDEICLDALESTLLYKEKIKIWHDQRIPRREFKVDEKVLVFNCRL